MLARKYEEVHAIIKRWSRRYAEPAAQQLIYMPVVSLTISTGSTELRGWTHDLNQRLNLLARWHPHLVASRCALLSKGHGARVIISRLTRDPKQQFLPREFF